MDPTLHMQTFDLHAPRKGMQHRMMPWQVVGQPRAISCIGLKVELTWVQLAQTAWQRAHCIMQSNFGQPLLQPGLEHGVS